MIHLASMTDEELVSYFRVTRNELTTTPLEEELAERLIWFIDRTEDESGLQKEIDQMSDTNADLSERVRELEDEIEDMKISRNEEDYK